MEQQPTGRMRRPEQGRRRRRHHPRPDGLRLIDAVVAPVREHRRRRRRRPRI